MQRISHKSRSATLSGQIIHSMWFEITLLNGTSKKWQRAQVGIFEANLQSRPKHNPSGSPRMAGTSKLHKPCRECTMSFPLLFLSQPLLFHSLVTCISELTSFYQTPAPCGISQPAGHRHVVLIQPKPASSESRRMNPGSFASYRLQGTSLLVTKRIVKTNPFNVALMWAFTQVQPHGV